jgi:hypothetical protein
VGWELLRRRRIEMTGGGAIRISGELSMRLMVLFATISAVFRAMTPAAFGEDAE